MQLTSIEWTDFSSNPIKLRLADGRLVNACVKVSDGCRNCYAEAMTRRYWPKGQKFPGYSLPLIKQGTAEFIDAEARKLLTSKKLAGKRVFIGDMTDVFGDWVPFELLDRLFAVFALRPDVTFQVLTKRPERMAEYFNGPVPLSTRADLVAGMHPLEVGGKPFAWGEPMKPWQRGAATDKYCRCPWPGWPLPNVWLGTSVENQAAADKRIPELLKCPAAVRFLSCEPLLGLVDLTRAPYPLAIFTEADGAQHRCGLTQRVIGYGTRGIRKITQTPGIHWVIVGGESSAGARPFNIEWARGLVAQCRAAGVPVFVKQLGGKPERHVVAQGDEAVRLMGLDFGSGATVTVASFDSRTTLSLDDAKGGDMAEWPEDLRVREFPAAEAAR